jgi:hypothetical protein
MKLPMMPSTLEPPISGWFFQITPMGAPRFVTNEIMAYRKNIVTMAMTLPFCF